MPVEFDKFLKFSKKAKKVTFVVSPIYINYSLNLYLLELITAKIRITRWVALMIQLGKFFGGVGWVSDTNYLYSARWGWINMFWLKLT